MIRKLVLAFALLNVAFLASAQLSPTITSWLQNTTQTGSYYASGNSNTIPNNILVNCQQVEYSNNFVYVTATGIPSYPTGPFLDGNPSQATNRNAIYQIPLNPLPNSGAPDPTTGGNIGIFINGVSLFDYRDGVAWNTSTNALCGGPGNPPCPGGPMAMQDWNRDAIPAERGGFDCAKGHPANGNYHHHQNPSAFKLDLVVVSNICNLYDADGLYTIDSTNHSPLIGYAYDGFPIYGAYGYLDTNGTGPITRIKSSYQLRNITQRTEWADGTNVDDGPAVGGIYPIGYFREDYAYIANPATDYLDEHNGRFCVTPEYPNGTYAYFATVDENWNSAYPYVVGPTYYGNASGTTVNSVTEPTTIYTPSGTSMEGSDLKGMEVSVFPNPANDLIAVQANGLLKSELKVELLEASGKLVLRKTIPAGSTISYFDTQTLYSGLYIVRISQKGQQVNHKIVLQK